MTKYSLKQLQPLMFNQHVNKHYHQFRTQLIFYNKLEHFRKADLANLGIDELPMLNAIVKLNLRGYHYDEVIRELLYQMPNQTKELSIKLPVRKPAPMVDHHTLEAELFQYGYKPQFSKQDWEMLEQLEVSIGLCRAADFLNAIAYQIIIHPAEIKLQISQDKTIQKQWALVHNNIIVGNYPKATIAKAKITHDGSTIIDPTTRTDQHK